jgi:hypothetical protein
LQPLLEATRAELNKLPTSRSVAELESLIRRGCGSPAALAGHVRTPCPRYDAERGIAYVTEYPPVISRATRIMIACGHCLLSRHRKNAGQDRENTMETARLTAAQTSELPEVRALLLISSKASFARHEKRL